MDRWEWASEGVASFGYLWGATSQDAGNVDPGVINPLLINMGGVPGIADSALLEGNTPRKVNSKGLINPGSALDSFRSNEEPAATSLES